MKTALQILLTLISLASFSQEKINEKVTIKNKHIDFSNQYIYFELSGLIELDGVIYLNDTCQCPIVYKATIDKIELVNKCNKEKYKFIKFMTYNDKKIISISEHTILYAPPVLPGIQLF